MKRLYLILILFLVLSNWTTAQEMYSYHVEWNGKEVIGDSILNRTYNLFQGCIYTYSDCELDSLKMDWTIGDGVREWGGTMYDKGYAHGYQEGLEEIQHDYEVMRWIFAGTAVFIVTWGTLRGD